MYFSSDVYNRQGDLDVFVCKIFENSISQPIKLNAPAYSEEDKESFLSDKQVGRGVEDIYAFVTSFPLEFECQQEISGIVKNRVSQELLPNVEIVLYDENENKLQSILSNESDASFSFRQSCNTNYTLKGYLDGYLTGELDIKYFTQSGWEKAHKISGVTMAQSILVNNRYCHSCVIGCGRRVAIKEGEYKTEEIEGPEYETLVSFGSLLLNDNLESIAYMNKKCFDYGIDTISSGGVIGCLTHHFYLGNIPLSKIDDIKPEWENIRVAERFLKKIVFREGIGDVLADGSDSLAEKFNLPQDEIATVNGLEVTYHDLRSNYGMAIAYGIGGAHKGPSHNLCDMYFVLMGIPFEEIDAPTVTLDKYSENKEMAKACSILHSYHWLRYGGPTWSTCDNTSQHGLRQDLGRPFQQHPLRAHSNRAWSAACRRYSSVGERPWAG